MPLMPRTMAIDFTYSVIGRDYVFRTMLPGIPAPDSQVAYLRPQGHGSTASCARTGSIQAECGFDLVWQLVEVSGDGDFATPSSWHARGGGCGQGQGH
jgi:hypothetical protein